MTHVATPASASLRDAQQRMAELPQTLKQVAEYLLEYPEFAITASAREIAKATGTSDASVVRTAHALGFDGLKPLRRALTESLSFESDPAQIMKRKVSRSRHSDVLHNMVSDTHTSLQNLVTDEFSESWTSAIQLLLECRSVLAYGVKPVGFVAEYLAFMLARIGVPAQASTQTGISLADQLISVDVDVAVVFAPQRVFSEISTLIDRVKADGARVILVTERQQHPLRSTVDVLLRTPRTVLGSAVGEITIPAMIAQALATALAAAEPDRAQSALEAIAAIRKQI